MWGNSLWAFSSSIYTCIYFTITVGARFVALFHYFAKCPNLHFVALLFSPSNSSCLKSKSSRGNQAGKTDPRNFRFHWLFERYWQGTELVSSKTNLTNSSYPIEQGPHLRLLLPFEPPWTNLIYCCNNLV